MTTPFDPFDPFGSTEDRSGIVDVSQLLEDQRALDLLAGSTLDPADLDDRTLSLLAVWVAQARTGEFDRPAALQPHSVNKVSRRSRLSARLRGSVAGVTVTTALLGLGSGVAAAVTGDPLAGLDGLRSAATVAVRHPDATHELRLSYLGQQVRKKVVEAQSLAEQGDVVEARQVLQEAEETTRALDSSEQNSARQEAAAVQAHVAVAAKASPGGAAAPSGTAPKSPQEDILAAGAGTEPGDLGEASSARGSAGTPASGEWRNPLISPVPGVPGEAGVAGTGAPTPAASPARGAANPATGGRSTSASPGGASGRTSTATPTGTPVPGPTGPVSTTPPTNARPSGTATAPRTPSSSPSETAGDTTTTRSSGTAARDRVKALQD